MKSYRSASLYTVKLREHQHDRWIWRLAAHRLAALAVSITLPPPTLQGNVRVRQSGHSWKLGRLREEVREIMLS
jgi:hypothetical protein